MISLGLLSDSNSFRFNGSDKSSLAKVDFVIDDCLNIPRIQVETIRESSGVFWKNPRLADPSTHTSALLESWASLLKLPDCENLLLVTTKDEVYLESLRNQLPNSCKISHLSLLNSGDLREIDECSKHFAISNRTVFDLVFLRHALEHSMNPLKLLKTLSSNLSSRGIIILEVPLFLDSESFLEQFWEEHIFYFSIETLLPLLSLAGLEVVDYKNITTENEPVLAILAKLNSHLDLVEVAKDVDRDSLFDWVGKELFRARSFFDSFSKSTDIVFIGANHKSINLIDLSVPEKRRVFLLDGDAQKIGKYTTRFDLEVLDLKELDSFNNAKFLTTINPRKLRSVVEKHLRTSDKTREIQDFYSEVRKSIF